MIQNFFPFINGFLFATTLLLLSILGAVTYFFVREKSRKTKELGATLEAIAETHNDLTRSQAAIDNKIYDLQLQLTALTQKRK